MGRGFDVLVGLAVILGTVFAGLTWWGLTPPQGGIKSVLPSNRELPSLQPLAILGLVVLISTWTLIAVRLGWIGDNPRIHGRMFPIDTGVYVGQILVSVDKLESDLFMEIGIVAYNGTTKFISISSVDGSVSYDGTLLPQAKWLGERSPSQNLPTAKEFLILLEQRVPRERGRQNFDGAFRKEKRDA